MLTYKLKRNILLLITFIGIILVFFIPPIPQNACYHHFADSREIAGIPNFYNVLSNGLFLIAGSAGIVFTVNLLLLKHRQAALWNYFCFFTGIILTGIGSAYYHMYPSTETLVWDRLPMTITFMAFLSIIIAEFIGKNLGKKLLLHLLFVGIVSVMYWYTTELKGHGDLRLYVLVQFLPLILIPLILILFNKKDHSGFFYWAILSIYIVAKIAETTDARLFSITQFISGHTLKHLIASLAPLVLLSKLWKENRFQKI